MKEILDAMRLVSKLTESIEDDAADLSKSDIQAIVDGYLVAALWSSTDTVDGEDVELDNFIFADETKEKLTANIVAFAKKHADVIVRFTKEENKDFSQVGHSAWLNSNGHGAGFFDYSGDAAKELDSLCGQLKGYDLYVGDDELVYC